MKIATWNVNSIRTRLAHSLQWLENNPDVDLLCLQETKVPDEVFPRSAFEEAGFHLYIFGQKSYNGVALISRSPLEDVGLGFTGVLSPEIVGDLDDQKRVISGILNGIRIVNVYVPNGSEIESEKYHYKLRWLKLLKVYLEDHLQRSPDLLICGDFNIALEDIDIHNPKTRATHIMSSDVERSALLEVLSLGLRDTFRKFTQDGDQYSWWDYRSASFVRNAGWRIDHHYVTDGLYDRTLSCTIDPEPRKLEQPSDHTPVIVELADS